MVVQTVWMIVMKVLPLPKSRSLTLPNKSESQVDEIMECTNSGG